MVAKRAHSNGDSTGQHSTGTGKVFPTAKDDIQVCFLDEGGHEIWWDAVVLSVDRGWNKSKRSAITAHIFKIKYAAQHGFEAQVGHIAFKNRYILRNLCKNGSTANHSKWRFADHLPDTSRSTVAGPCTDVDKHSHASNKKRAKKTRSLSISKKSAKVSADLVIGDDTEPSRTRLDHEQEGSAQSSMLERRLSVLEADLKSMQRSRLSTIEDDLLREIRVDAKLGILSVLRRSTTRVTWGSTEGLGMGNVVRTGVIRWTCNCAMSRFKLVVLGIHEHFFKQKWSFNTPVNMRAGEDSRKGCTTSKAKVHFNPNLEKLDKASGFGSAEILFASGKDLFDFLGHFDSADIRRIVWQKDRDGNYIRMLGSLQTCGTGGNHSIRFFVGASSAREGRPNTTDEDNGDQDLRMDENHMASCVTYEDGSWDAENNCFNSTPLLQAHDPQFSGNSSGNETAFKINWVLDAPRTQRQFAHATVDLEGVRRGVMTVEVPYVLFGPELMSEVCHACGEQ